MRPQSIGGACGAGSSRAWGGLSVLTSMKFVGSQGRTAVYVRPRLGTGTQFAAGYGFGGQRQGWTLNGMRRNGMEAPRALGGRDPVQCAVYL